jgi:hypothetical protein
MTQGEGSLRTCDVELARVWQTSSHMNGHVQISYPIALTKLTRAPVCLCVSQYIQIAPS